MNELKQQKKRKTRGMKKLVLDEAIEAAQTFFNDKRINKDRIWRLSKERRYAHPRHFVCAFMRARDPNKFSYPVIANAVKRADHTTALNSVRKAHKLWGQALFIKLAAVSAVDADDGDTSEQLMHRSASFDEIMVTGEANLARFTNGSGWSSNSTQEAA